MLFHILGESGNERLLATLAIGDPHVGGACKDVPSSFLNEDVRAESLYDVHYRSLGVIVMGVSPEYHLCYGFLDDMVQYLKHQRLLLLETPPITTRLWDILRYKDVLQALICSYKDEVSVPFIELVGAPEFLVLFLVDLL